MKEFRRPAREIEIGEPTSISIEDMLHEIDVQSATISAVIDAVDTQLQQMDSAVFEQATRVYLTGCGDSYFAALAARYAIERFSGVPTDALEALEFGRYVAEFVPPSSLVFGISNSGQVARTVEAVINARLAGAYTIAVTGNRDGWLAEETDHTLDQSVRIEGQLLNMPTVMDQSQERAEGTRPTFGLANYLASLTTLYLTSLHLALVRGVLSGQEANALRDELRGSAELVQETVELCSEAALDYSARVKDAGHLTVLGAGPNLATSLFYAAKTFELARYHGVAQQLEEWAHEQFFITDKDSHLLVIAPPGRSVSRAVEILQLAGDLGATTAVVTDRSATELTDAADIVLPIAGGLREEFSPLVACIPGELLATHLAQASGREAFSFDSQQQFILNMMGIKGSRIVEYRPE